ncbi:collagen triple helix repeat-containing protein 1-like [Patiria miniata]|uniref:CTHRC1 C-terminal domain-containing protein n=1 Tax=Patiria miniata TaxID=46514 RepID=A0A914BIF8_PATMI|nr:collagen triple helix repeat-containing protein 1-like [Patiria miniata]
MAANVITLTTILLLSWLPLLDLQCVGPKGAPGPQGPKGGVGDSTDADWRNVLPVRNWRQCTWDYGDGRDSGVIYTCQFEKKFDSTSIFMAYGGNTRITNCHGCCGRWYFTINGAECSNPQVIDGTVYMAHFTAADLHRHRTVQGYCNGISAGWIDVTFNVGNCNGYGSYDLYTGWNSVSRIVVEEFPASPYG